MKVIMEMDQAKLEEIIRDFVTKRGLQLAKVDKAIQWKTRRGLAAVVQIEEPDEQEEAEPPAAVTAPQRAKPRRAAAETPDVKLSPGMFPDPVAAAALLEAEAQETEDATDSSDEDSVVYPGETSVRTQEVRTLADLKPGSGPKRGAGR